jgi:site-specific recombinase XerD
MAKAKLRLVGPATENRTVTPKRKANAELRTREYLTDAEVARLTDAAKGNRWAHPHMLRHTCGFALANKGHDTRALQAYLGHRNIQHTVRYTELAPDRSKDFWR